MMVKALSASCVRIAVAALLVGVTSLAVAVAQAEAPHVNSQSSSTTLPGDDTTHTVSANCKGNDTVAGGGLKSGDPNNDYFQGSYPTGTGKWTAAGFRASSAQPPSSKTTSYARCLDSGKVKTRSKTVTLNDGDSFSSSSVVAQCKSGEHLLGGGGRLSDDINDYFQGSFPSGSRGWKAVGNTYGFDDTSITAYALCAKHVSTKKISDTKTMSDHLSSVTAECPKHYAVTGGGLKVGDTFADSLAGSYPKGTSWVAQGFGAGDKLTAYALCLK